MASFLGGHIHTEETSIILQLIAPCMLAYALADIRRHEMTDEEFERRYFKESFLSNPWAALEEQTSNSI